MPGPPEPPPASGTAEPASPPAPALRVSDADREATAERLRQACAEGRLDAEELEELEERLEQTYRARSAPMTQTRHDLPRATPAASVDPEPNRPALALAGACAPPPPPTSASTPGC